MYQSVSNHASGPVPSPRQWQQIRRFGRLGLATIIIIYLLILVGGIVRATGAGMGCPDWPTCFGQWVPPTSEAELPANYQQIYAAHGYADTTFNVRKTWTEYVNRLLGVFTGLMILLTLLAAWRLRQLDRVVFGCALAAFLLVALQGWLGARVVASNLDPVMITLHMVLAQVIVLVLIYGIARSQQNLLRQQSASLPRWTAPLLLITMLITLFQLLLGTQVREAIDLIAQQSNHENRHLWIDNLPWFFTLHRLSAIPVVLLNGIVLYLFLFRGSGAAALQKAALVLLLVLTGTVVMGMAMDKLNMPMFAQPLHLLLASAILGLQYFLFIGFRYTGETSHADELSV